MSAQGAWAAFLVLGFVAWAQPPKPWPIIFGIALGAFVALTRPKT